MTDRPRDWDRELADIDKLIEKMPTPAARPSGAGTPAPRASGAPPAPGAPGSPPVRPGAMLPPTSKPRRSGRGATIRIWALLLLVIALAAVLPFWPYANGCGPGLYLYLAAVAVVPLGAIWVAALSWSHRRGFAHFLAILALIWGLVLLAERVLPRVGYAAVPMPWACEEGPIVAPGTVSQPPTSADDAAPEIHTTDPRANP